MPRVLTKQRLAVICIVFILIVGAAYLKFHFIQDTYENFKLSNEKCFTELKSATYQLNVVTEYKNRIDKLLTDMEKAQKAEKESFSDISDSCVAMKQQSLICQSQFDDLQSECRKIKDEFEKLKNYVEKAKPAR